MINKFHFLSLTFIGLFILELSGQELQGYGNISVQANIVTLDERMSNLILDGDVIIHFEDFKIAGDKALLSYVKERLIIDGSPASISSEKRKVNGAANKFIISPNLSMEMVGNASLLQDNRSIFAEQITYQISSND